MHSLIRCLPITECFDVEFNYSLIQMTDTLFTETMDLNEEIVTKVVKQLEYYFSDYNLSRDLFLKRVLNEGNGCKQGFEPNFCQIALNYPLLIQGLISRH